MISLRTILPSDWVTFQKTHPRAFADLVELALRGELTLLRNQSRQTLNRWERKRLDELEVWDRMRQIRETDSRKAS